MTQQALPRGVPLIGSCRIPQHMACSTSTWNTFLDLPTYSCETDCSFVSPRIIAKRRVRTAAPMFHCVQSHHIPPVPCTCRMVESLKTMDVNHLVVPRRHLFWVQLSWTHRKRSNPGLLVAYWVNGPGRDFWSICLEYVKTQVTSTFREGFMGFEKSSNPMSFQSEKMSQDLSRCADS